MIKAGIIGGAGYTAGELIRLLINHPDVTLDFVFSTSNAGNEISSVHQDLVGQLSTKFSSTINKDVDILFLCLGHGNSKEFLDRNQINDDCKIVDLSNDFRLNADKKFEEREFIYGLPEINKDAIKNASAIANPGCFATAIQLAVLPLANGGLLLNDIHVNAVTGSTGAGTGLSSTTHFAWRDNNFSSYKEFNHQHLDEIYQSIKQLYSDFSHEINFIPNRGNFSRGIFASSYTKFNGSLDDAFQLYKEYYNQNEFVHVSNQPIHLKQVVNTNNCLIHLKKHNDKLLISSCIDNLLKGASGQAVQNMNLMFGLEEHKALKLKGSYF